MIWLGVSILILALTLALLSRAIRNDASFEIPADFVSVSGVGLLSALTAVASGTGQAGFHVTAFYLLMIWLLASHRRTSRFIKSMRAGFVERGGTRRAAGRKAASALSVAGAAVALIAGLLLVWQVLLLGGGSRGRIVAAVILLAFLLPAGLWEAQESLRSPSRAARALLLLAAAGLLVPGLAGIPSTLLFLFAAGLNWVSESRGTAPTLRP